MRVKTRRDRGGLEPKSKRGRRKRERPDYIEPQIRLRTTVDRTGTRPYNTENAYRRHRRTQQTNIYLRMQAITEQGVTTHDGARIRYERTGRRTDADLCSLRRREQRKQVGGAAGRTRTVLETARASSKPCNGKRWSRKQRESKNRERSSEIGSAALRPLHAR